MIMKKYTVIIKPLAEKDLRNLPKNDSVNILKKIISLENSFQGDIKKIN